MNKRILLACVVALCIAPLLLGACSTMASINHASLSEYHGTVRKADEGLLAEGQGVHPVGGPIISNLPYVSTHTIPHKAGLPLIFEASATLNAPSGEPVASIIRQVEAHTGIRVSVAGDLLSHAVKNGAAPAPTMDATLKLPPISALVGGRGTALSNVAIDYSGTVGGMFNALAQALDATWSYDAPNNRVRIYRYETRSFHIDTLPGDASSDANVSAGNGMGIQGGQGQTTRVMSSQTTTNFGDKLSVWSSIAAAVKPMLSSRGSMTISEPTATITVHDRWNRVARIARFIRSMNVILADQVEVNVAVYRVQLNNQDNRGINWGILYNAFGQMASNAGLTISTPHPSAAGLSALTLSAPTSTAAGGLRPFAGSQFFLNALSTLGKTSEITNASVETVNNQPAPVKVVQTTAYLAQTTSLYTDGLGGGNSGTGVVGAGATLTPGQVETGFNMQVLPSVQPDGRRLLLQVLLSVSTLNSLQSFTSGGETIQLPQVSAREFLQRAWMKSGQSLVLAGFQDSQTQNTTQTPLTKGLWLLGGNRDVTNARDVVVIVITPVVTAQRSTF